MRLAEGHLGSWHLLRVLPLTSNHRHLRLEGCHTRGNWTAAEWNQIVFSDESRFNVSSMTIVFVCGDSVVKASIPPFLYNDTPLPQLSHGKIVEVEIGGVTIYRAFGEFRRANSYCHLYGAQGLGQRQAYF
ncbi:HTH_Tnp_Tc3_2 domain-containing protein [Trichonephila clavipes]|uniref:HTH_Tnp_Tc3_2 domain-containing protein n=1 Tax=Trichonephila clavipes TaxID=2585209 RepID=A0A8X6VLL3_TRICX|nr:HTH_Tnp_Tc3_2 domain-containing protein [Trichonephila clavipes]